MLRLHLSCMFRNLLSNTDLCFCCRINDFFLLGFIDRELEERRFFLECLTNKYESSKFSLEAEKECANSSYVEILETRRQIEYFIVSNTETNTGIMYADKLLR